jgi:hypothetical protein
METRKKVLIVIPTEGNIHHTVVGVLCQIILNTKYDIDTCISQMRGIGEHRNVMVKHFLNGDWDYMLQIDADNPPPKNVLDLIELDKEVIGLPTPIQMSPIRGLTELFWNVFNSEGYPVKNTGQGLEEVYGVGSGCILIRRDVLEKIKHPFTTIRDEEDLRIISTDLAFCKRCRENGVKIWTNWDYKCSHYKQIDLSTLFIQYAI